MRPGIVVHGGAGILRSLPRRSIDLRRVWLEKAVKKGFAELGRGSAVDAVEAAVALMEESNVFNAGIGSCLTLDGKIEVDAAIMDGRDLSAGAVGGIEDVAYPIEAARKVMEKTDHILIVGGAWNRVAPALGVASRRLKPSKERLRRYRSLRKDMEAGRYSRWERNSLLLKEHPELAEGETVGAVAVDRVGNVASGVSTGGRWLKLPGRVGDSAVIGAGLYADNEAGAAAATGSGEAIIKVCLSKAVCDFMRSGLSAQMACEAGIGIVTERLGAGTAGVVAVDGAGNPGAAYNTEGMGTAYLFCGMRRPSAYFFPEDRPRRSRGADSRTRKP